MMNKQVSTIYSSLLGLVSGLCGSALGGMAGGLVFTLVGITAEGYLDWGAFVALPLYGGIIGLVIGMITGFLMGIAFGLTDVPDHLPRFGMTVGFVMISGFGLYVLLASRTIAFDTVAISWVLGLGSAAILSGYLSGRFFESWGITLVND